MEMEGGAWRKGEEGTVDKRLSKLLNETCMNETCMNERCMNERCIIHVQGRRQSL